MGAQCSTSCSKQTRHRPDNPAPPRPKAKAPAERGKPRSWLSDKQASEAQMRLEALNPPIREKEAPVDPPIQAPDFATFQHSEALLSPHYDSDDPDEDPVPMQPKGSEGPARNLLPSFEEAR